MTKSEYDQFRSQWNLKVQPFVVQLHGGMRYVVTSFKEAWVVCGEHGRFPLAYVEKFLNFSTAREAQQLLYGDSYGKQKPDSEAF